MKAKDKGLLARSVPITYSDGDVKTVDLSFLYRYMHQMKAPVCREIMLHFSGDISGVTGGFDNKDGCQIFSNIKISDEAGTFYNLSGKLARLDSIMELGSGAAEVDGLADAASGATTSGDDLLLRIPFDLKYARNGADTALPLSHLTEGGELELTFGTPANATGVSGSVTVYLVLHDEKVRELKARLVRKSQAITAEDDNYPLNGSIRQLVLASNPSGASYSAWTGSTYTALNVEELGLSKVKSYILKEEYRRLRVDRNSDDPVIDGLAVPLVTPSSGQRVDKMPDLKSVHIDLGTSTVPTSAQLFISQIQDRHPGLAAKWMGYSDEARFLAAVAQNGVVALSGGQKVKATAINATHARRLPMQIPKMGA